MLRALRPCRSSCQCSWRESQTAAGSPPRHTPSPSPFWQTPVATPLAHLVLRQSWSQRFPANPCTARSMGVAARRMSRLWFGSTAIPSRYNSASGTVVFYLIQPQPIQSGTALGKGDGAQPGSADVPSLWSTYIIENMAYVNHLGPANSFTHRPSPPPLPSPPRGQTSSSRRSSPSRRVSRDASPSKSPRSKSSSGGAGFGGRRRKRKSKRRGQWIVGDHSMGR